MSASPAAASATRPIGSRGRVPLERARSLLAAGRPAAALECVRRARRLCGGEQGLYLALLHWEALVALRRCHEALAVATRALARAPRGSDLSVRLRIARGQSLWLMGRVGPGEAEVHKALAQAREPLTRARAEETLAFFAWKRQDLERARRHVAAALPAYRETGYAAGMLRALGRDTGVLRDAGRLEDALALEDRRLALAQELDRPDAQAQARCDRAAVLAAMGRWDEVERELDEGARLFRLAGDAREFTVAGIQRVYLDLARGELGAARSRLERARKLDAEAGHTRALARNLLLTSDVLLAAGDLEAAERTAVEALGLFRVAQDDEGECRSRVRRSHALVGLGRPAEAKAEARRALRCASKARADLAGLALIALGRAQLRGRREEAAASFEAALALPECRSAARVTAQLGLALARATSPVDPAIVRALEDLEAWGDRRLLVIAVGEVRRLAGSEAVREVHESAAPVVLAEGVDAAGVLVDAACALWEAASWPEGWAAAVRALRPALPWRRAVLLDAAACELLADRESVEALPEADLARELAAQGPGPRVVDLRRDPVLRMHPQRVLDHLGAALLAPVGDGALLYLDVREERGELGGRELSIATQLARLLASRPREADSPEPPAVFPEIVGRCDAVRELFSGIARLAACDEAVYVYGETGTGKENVARALHRASRRGGARFVAVNASSLSDAFFEAELFGHTRGAFTGAIAERQGLASEAQGGTLFIDEVADLSPRVQAKLLRFLQEGEYRRLGENLLRRADFRLVTASNVRLEEAVAAGRFREDLMYRLKTLVLSLPPLRERGDDVLLLARHFLATSAARAGTRPPRLSPDALRALRAFAWPGNVRQLQSEMLRARVQAGTGTLRREHLSPEVRDAPGPENSPLRAAMARFERDYIVHALGCHGGNRARTACALGLTRQALVAKIARYAIS